MRSSYDIYCEHCAKIGQPPPTKEWWEKACKQFRTVHFESDVEFDARKEREGDAQ